MTFLDAIRRSAQDPFGGSIEFDAALGGLYGREAYVFSAIVHPDEEDGRPDFRQAFVRGEPYSEYERSLYENLSDEAKLEVLGFETVLLHEITHQIDTFTTPFGAVLQVWQVEEFIRLFPVICTFALNPALDISKPLTRSLDSLDPSDHRDFIEELFADTGQIRTLDDFGPGDVAPGWHYEDKSLEGRIMLFEDGYEAVTIFGRVRTIRNPAGRVVTLRGVLETHALSNCLRRIVWRFRDDPAVGARETLRYLRFFYPPGLAEDYRFAFDAVSRALGFADLEDLLEWEGHLSHESLEQIPMLAGLLSWTALHSGDPPERLVFVADYLAGRLREGKGFASPGDILRHLDELAEVAPSATEALELGREAVRVQRQRIPPEPTGLSVHFDSMLAAVDRELTLRIGRGTGLGDPVGTPNEGNPAPYLRPAQAETFGGQYGSDPDYVRWRLLRTLLLSRYRRSADKHAALREWFAAG